MLKQTRQPSTYLPVGPHLEDAFVDKPKWLDPAAWVLGGVYIRTHSERFGNEDAGVPLSSALLKQVMPFRHYAQILGRLVTAGLLEKSANYFVGKQCSSYRLGPVAKRSGFRKYIFRNPKFASKVEKFAESQRIDNLMPLEVGECDDQSVIFAIEANLEAMSVSEDAPVGISPEDLPLVRIKDGDKFCKICPQQRVHTSLSNLKRDYRKHLRLDGQKLACVDVKCCQPMLLALVICSQSLPCGESFAARLKSLKWATNIPKVSCDPESEDYQLYLSLCARGRLYEFLLGRLGWPPTKAKRDKLKKLFLAVIYGKPRDADTKVGKVFMVAFPTVWETILSLKANNHAQLPRLMQCLEAHVVVFSFGKAMASKYPGVRWLSLHDAIFVGEEDIAIVQNVLEDIFNSCVGVLPMLKIEKNWSSAS